MTTNPYPSDRPLREFTLISGIPSEVHDGFDSVSLLPCSAQSPEEAVLGAAATEINDTYPFLVFAGHVTPIWSCDEAGTEALEAAARANAMLATEG